MLVVFFKSKLATGVVVGVVVGVVGVVGPLVAPVTELEIALANAVTTA